MKMMNSIKIIIAIITLLAVSNIEIEPARAHCDTMDGPVIMDAKKALETKNINLVLIWVQAGDEGEIKKAFDKAIGKRNLSSGKEAADREFFETLVRVHRAGEGAGYEGLKPAGTELNPAVQAADMAIKDGKIGPVITLLTSTMNEKVNEKFNNAYGKKNYDPNDVQAGREYVKAYVEYVHYIEWTYNTFHGPAGHHDAEGHGHGDGHRVFLHLALAALTGLIIGAFLMFLVRRKPAKT